MISQAVYDCMIYLQAAGGSRGAAWQCFQVADAGSVEVFVSASVLREVRDVLTRPRTRKKFPILTDAYVNQFLRRLAGFVTFHTGVEAKNRHSRDPKDDKYLNLAIAANARYVVTRDNDLLDLMKPDDAEGIVFRSSYPTIEILDPPAFLHTLTPA